MKHHDGLISLVFVIMTVIQLSYQLNTFQSFSDNLDKDNILFLLSFVLRQEIQRDLERLVVEIVLADDRNLNSSVGLGSGG
jgi:hypothetical protein